MFISKKKFNEAIEKAKAETQQDMWEHERINMLEKELHNRISRLEERIIDLENKGKHKRKDNGITPNYWG